ncbi:BMP family ABC transporter substrate-binding protein, partial [Ruminococcaceae bacterium OttesenSCG-928-D13]|nr:BMP family ABC transporter substrate-binding protein [Ruminococcaceae bacterium OttesenSCG-928-D13]
ALGLAVCLMFGCSSGGDPLDSLAASTVAPPASTNGEATGGGARLALVTTEARLESTFGQAVWNAMVRFSGEKGVTKGYYIAEGDGEEAAQNALELALRGGAELVLAMDGTVTKAVGAAAGQNPEVGFVLMDCGEPLPARDNLTELRFSPVQAGWLAGYTAVYEEQNTLGVVQYTDTGSSLYALGFALGADYGAAEQGLAPGGTRLVWQDPEPRAKDGAGLLTAELLESGAGLVFAAVPAEAQAEVLELVQAAGGKLFGIGLSLSHQGTSALASLDFEPRNLLLSVLEAWHADRLSGQVVMGQVADGDIALNVEAGRFANAREWILSQGALRFEDGTLAAELAEATAEVDGKLPRLDELTLTHLVVTPPGPPPEIDPPAVDPDPAPGSGDESLPPESTDTSEAT